ncbi:MAG: aminoglycoside phosphotransferase family protein [Planctomycetota bacterium]|nr:aminoglycoside phosphotransferase family protein [Planctomycetota bacterium]
MPLESSNFVASHRVDAGGNCQVWAGHLSDGTPAFLKQFSESRSWKQEQQALLHWLPRLAPDLAHLPRLLDQDPHDKSLLISAVPGVPIEKSPLAAGQLEKVMQQAGHWLAALHRLDFQDTDELSLSDSLPLRLESWIENHGNSLTENEIAISRQRVGDGSIFKSTPRVPCHNDFQPRNWLWDGLQVGIIDFEHANANHPAFDWVRLETGIWQKAPELRDRFIEGYGEEPLWSDGDVLTAICAIYAVGCIVWGARHGEAAIVANGRRILD